MKILFAVLSCAEHANWGYHQAMRDTWLNGTTADCLFFLGGSEGEDFSPDINQIWNQNTQNETYSLVQNTDAKALAVKEPDEIILDARDDYKHLPFKTRELCKFVVANGYDFVYKCDTDTYARPDRLLASGFQNHDYTGTPNKWEISLPRESNCECLDCLKKYPKGRTELVLYANGGPGYWMSAKAADIISRAPVTHWAEDIWIGRTLAKNGIVFTPDTRYSPSLSASRVLKNNNVISQHLSEGPGTYHKSFMYIADGHWRRSGL